MSTLAQQQNALLSALFAWPAGNVDTFENSLEPCLTAGSHRGLRAYRTNGHALAERALTAAYPVLMQLLGKESFANLACALWHAHPPSCADLAQWGHALPDFVRGSAQLADEPYLGDVAQLEWALHQCAFAADVAAQPTTFSLLTEADPVDVQLILAPGTAVWASGWPVTDIVQAHRDGVPDFAQLGHRIRSCLAQTTVVWRAGFAPQLRNAVDGESLLLASLASGASLATALDGAGALEFSTWLPMAVQTGLVLGVRATS